MAGAAGWDSRFRAGDHVDSQPDALLVSSQEWLGLLQRGAAALDLACGAGRHAVWLAQQGFRVTAIDFSAEALRKTERLAADKGVAVRGVQQDLESAADLGSDAYDLICGFFFLHRPLFPALRASLRPGGLIIYKTHTVDQLLFPGRPRNRLHLLGHNELLRLLDGFRILAYEERVQERATAAIIAQKPMAD